LLLEKEINVIQDFAESLSLKIMRDVGQISLKNLSAKLESVICAEYERLGCSAKVPLGVHAG